MNTTLRAACVQFQARPEKADNLADMAPLVAEAAGKGADIVLLPEKWNAWLDGPGLRAQAERVDLQSNVRTASLVIPSELRELNTVIGVARTRCNDAEVNTEIRGIQRELFVVGSAVSTRPEAKKPIPVIGKEMVHRLDALVERWEAEPGILRDWSIPGEYAGSAGFDVARAICRRAERANVRYVSNGGDVQPTVLEYLNRLSDVLWLAARVIEARAGIDARLRDDAHPGPPWSRAW